MTVRGSKKINQEHWREAVRKEIDEPELRQKYYEALRKAQKRIGSAPTEVLKWLIAFAKEDLGELAIDPLRERGYEVAYFSIFGSTTSGDVSPYSLLMHDRTVTGWSQEVASRLSLPNRQDLLSLQIKVRHILDHLIEQGYASVWLHELTLTIRTTAKKRRGWLDVTCSHIQDKFLYHMAPLLTNHAGWIRRCGDSTCNCRFLGMRRIQRFCSVACQNRVASRRFRNQKEVRQRRQARSD